MNYPQYIYPPTTVPVQRYFANPYVQINKYYDGGDFLGVAPTTLGKIKNAGIALWNGLEGSLGADKLSKEKGGLVSGVASVAGNGLYKGLSGGLSSGAGKAFSGIGNVAGGLISKVNPVLGAAVTVGGNLLGGIANWGWGTKRNAAGINAFNADTDEMNNTRVGDSSYESIANQAAAQNWGGAFDYSDMGKTGVFNKGAFKDEYNKMMRNRASSQNYMVANYDNASTNVQKNMMNNLLMNSAAYGGYFDNPFSHPGSGAIAYGLEQQNLANQQQFLGQMQPQQNQMQMPFSGGGNTFGCGGNKYCLGGKFFSDGGNLNSHGSDFTNGLVYIENGGTHEENPYQGVPMGYDQQGTPNVVEEDEVIAPKKLLGEGGAISDYVFSNRIPVTDEFAEKYHLPYGISIAEAIKKLTKESRETPNDIIHENTNKKLLAEARDMQEQIKQEQQEQQQMAMQEAFAQMPPEQQQAIMQQQQIQDMAMQEQAPEQGQEMAALGIQEPAMGAFGGNLFGCGGRKYSAGGFFNPVNMYAYGNEFNKGITPQDAWEAIMLPEFMKQLQSEFGADGADVQTIIDRYNKLQDLYKSAGMLGYNGSVIVNDNIKPLQEYFQSLGMNRAFTQDLIDEYYNNATHGGRTPDKMDLFNPDGRGGGYTALRTLGAGALSTDSVEAMNNALNRYGVEYVQDNDGLWRLQQLSDAANSATSDSASPEAEKSDYEKLMEDLNSRDGKAGAATDKAWEPLDTSMRMAPIWASGIATLMDQLGLTNTPDYRGARQLEALAGQSRGFMPVSYKPVGERMSYNPFDPYQRMIAQNALAAANQRAIQDNSNGNAAMANAAIVAQNRNNAIAAGQLNLQDTQANNTQYERMLGFNRETDMTNSHGIFGADAHNAQNWRLGQNTYNSLIANALELRQQEKQAADAARALNMSNFVKGLSSLGKENMYYNMVMGSPTAGGYSYDRSGRWSFKGQPRGNTSAPSMATNPFFAAPPQWSTTRVASPAAQMQARFSLMPEQDYAWLQQPVQFFNYNG